MSILGTLDVAEFVREHWQRAPLLVRGAACDLHGFDAGELAGLACEDVVESRIVVHDAHRDEWRCEDGPFDEARFASLPGHGWTLLVQAVDHFSPRIAEL